MSNTTAFRIKPDNKKGLETLKKKLDRSASWIINEALKQFIAKNTK